LQCTPKGSTWGDSTVIQEHKSEGGFQEEANDKEGIMGVEFWTGGYYVATVGEWASWRTVERYIERPGKPREDLRQLKLFDLYPAACRRVLH
jgi:REP element-mobilizing transposase RayT